LLEACWELGLYATFKAVKDRQKVIATPEDLPTPQVMPTSFAIAE